MIRITATVRSGRLELDVPPDWPDGTEVEIAPRSLKDADDGPLTSEEIARTLAAMEGAEPLHFTDEERAMWEKARAERRAWEKADFNRQADALGKLWP